MRKRNNWFQRAIEYLKDNPFLAVLLGLLVLGTLVFGIYKIVYSISVGNQQELYESIWDSASDSAKDVDNLNAEVIELMIPSSVSGDSVSQENPFMSVEEFLALEGNRDKYEEYLEVGMLDFTVLLGYNSDTIGYLLIPETPVSYPVLQNIDNSYYLNHNIDGSEGYPGCLFIENYNTPDFQDAINVIYGHNMGNDTMFGTINEYDAEEYRLEHPYFFLYKPDGVQIYEVVIASAYSNEHLLSDCFTPLESGGYLFEGIDNAETLGLVSRVKEYGAWGAYINESAIAEGDQLLVLSTCASGDVRYIVAGKRIV